MKKIVFLFVVIIVAIVIAAIVTASRGRFDIFVPLTIIFPFAILAFIFSLIRRSRLNKEKLLKTGEPAKAKILSVSETGVYINNKPRIAIELEVKPQTGLPFNAKIYAVISFLQPLLYQPGVILNVRYDMNNLKNIAIESFDKNDVVPNNTSGENNIEAKPLICPSCGGQIKLDKEQFKEKFITCIYCESLIDLHE